MALWKCLLLVGGLLCSVLHLQRQYQVVVTAVHLCQRRYGGCGCQLIYCMLVRDLFVVQ